MANAPAADLILSNLDRLLPDLEALYKDVHSHPELSMQETRTAGLAADRLRGSGYEVTTGIGKTGVVGLLRNGDGPTVMLRADMDALPVEEATSLSYSSKVKATDQDGKSVPVGHMCGHDMHVAWLAGAANLFSLTRDAWQGTLMVVFQPGEETAQGAQANPAGCMIALILVGVFLALPCFIAGLARLSTLARMSSAVIARL